MLTKDNCEENELWKEMYPDVSEIDFEHDLHEEIEYITLEMIINKIIGVDENAD